MAPVDVAGPQAFDVTANPPAFGSGTYRGTVVFQSTGLVQSALDVSLKVGSGISSVQINAVTDGTGFVPGIAPGSWATVSGGNLAPVTRAWRADEIVDGVLPTRLEGTGVTVNGRDAAVCFVSPSQIMFQVPADIADGTVTILVANNGAPSNEFSVTLRQRAPELFRFLPSTYATALHANYRVAARPDLFPGCTDVTLCPAFEARPGETVLLFGTGFGLTAPPSPAGRVIDVPMPLASPVDVHFGSTTVTASAWLVGAGLYQINVKVPDSQPDGDVPLAVSIGGTTSAAAAQLTVKRAR